jgi:hypothetical protein
LVSDVEYEGQEKLGAVGTVGTGAYVGYTIGANVGAVPTKPVPVMPFAEPDTVTVAEHEPDP